jgi:ketosteroid isomerase-like protein
MSGVTSPRSVVESLLKGIENREWAELSALYDENVVIEHPFNVPEPSTINGKAALHAHFTAAPTRPFGLTVHNLVVRDTDDPEVVVAQYDYRISLPDKTVEVANILVVRVRNGLIVHSKDYHNHALVRALAEEAVKV